MARRPVALPKATQVPSPLPREKMRGIVVGTIDDGVVKLGVFVEVGERHGAKERCQWSACWRLRTCHRQGQVNGALVGVEVIDNHVGFAVSH